MLNVGMLNPPIEHWHLSNEKLLRFYERERPKEAKEVEKQRRANLTPEEVKSEAKAKRLANKLAKQAAMIPQNEEPVAEDADDLDEILDEYLFDDNEIDNISDRSFDL